MALTPERLAELRAKYGVTNQPTTPSGGSKGISPERMAQLRELAKKAGGKVPEPAKVTPPSYLQQPKPIAPQGTFRSVQQQNNIFRTPLKKLPENAPALTSEQRQIQQVSTPTPTFKESLKTPEQTKFDQAANPFGNKPNALGETTGSLAQKAAGGINAVYEKFTQLPPVKKFAEGVGNVVEAGGGLIGGTVGGLLETGVQTYKAAKGEGFDVGSIVDKAIQTGKETAAFGKEVGGSAAPMALLGPAGKAVQAALAFGQGYTGYDEFKKGKDEGDYVKMYEGLQNMVLSGFAAKHFGGMAKTDVLKSIEAAKKSTTPIKTGVGTYLKEAKKDLLLTKGAKEQTKSEYRFLTGKTETPIETKVKSYIATAIRPSVVGKGTATQQKAYYQKAYKAVDTIAENKENLSFNKEGEVVSGELPKSTEEFSQAVEQTKKQIFQEYDAKAKEAGQKGASVDLKPIANELDVVINNPVLNDIRPEIVKYAKAQKERFTKRGSYTAEQAQEAVQVYNQSLEAYYRNPNYDTASKALIDASIVNNIRKSLDTAIEEQVGPGYQELKNKYGALKTIEKDVNRRAVVDARKNVKGLIDFTDVFSGGQVLSGILKMNPAEIVSGLGQKGIAKWLKTRNDPNAQIMKMFESVENYRNNPAPKSILENVKNKAGLSIQDITKTKEYQAQRDAIANKIDEAIPEVQNMVNKGEATIDEWNELKNYKDKLEKGIETYADIENVKTLLKLKGFDPFISDKRVFTTKKLPVYKKAEKLLTLPIKK